MRVSAHDIEAIIKNFVRLRIDQDWEGMRYEILGIDTAASKVQAHVHALSDAHQKPITHEGEFSAADFAREFRRNHPSATVEDVIEALDAALSTLGGRKEDGR